MFRYAVFKTNRIDYKEINCCSLTLKITSHINKNTSNKIIFYYHNNTKRNQILQVIKRD